MKIIKRDFSIQEFDINKVKKAITKAYNSLGYAPNLDTIKEICRKTEEVVSMAEKSNTFYNINVIQNIVEKNLMRLDPTVGKAYILYKDRHDNLRKHFERKEKFLENYKQSNNTANATIDDNSNVATKNIAVLCHESHKEDNRDINRYFITKKIKELHPEFDETLYEKDLNSHIIYKHDESSLPYPTQYCAAMPMDEFLINGIKGLGGLSSAPKNLDSYCGMFVNLVFATSAQVLGAVAFPGFLVYYDWFARKEWGNNYYKKLFKPAKLTYSDETEETGFKTIKQQICQYFQQIV